MNTQQKQIGDGLTSKYTILANGNETKPFNSYKEAKTFALAWKGQFFYPPKNTVSDNLAKTFALAWKGQFSIFNEIVMNKDGKFFEVVEVEK